MDHNAFESIHSDVDMQRFAEAMGYVRADHLLDRDGVRYYQLVSRTWDECERWFEDAMAEWADGGCVDPMPRPPAIGIPEYCAVVNGFPIHLGTDETLEVMSLLPD